jgi:uncharacterized protein YndB with AHSA1/START domain
MNTRNIKHTVTLSAEPVRVYAALMDAEQHTGFTGERAEIDPQPGGAFRCYGNYIKGVTLELEPGKRIVQAWRSRNWPQGVYSIVSFRLSRTSGGKTLLRFTQIGVPAADHDKKDKGWRTHYWEPLRRFLASAKG